MNFQSQAYLGQRYIDTYAMDSDAQKNCGNVDLASRVRARTPPTCRASLCGRKNPAPASGVLPQNATSIRGFSQNRRPTDIVFAITGDLQVKFFSGWEFEFLCCPGGANALAPSDGLGTLPIRNFSKANGHPKGWPLYFLTPET
jgi:hypothetical protein